MSLQRSQIWMTRSPLFAQNGAIAAGPEPLAEIGVQIMREGGNAIDAGVAAAFAAQVVEPANCGAGGIGAILVHSAQKGETTIFNDGPLAPAAATPDMFELLPGSGGFYGWTKVRDDENILGYRSVALPSAVAGLCAAHARYGQLDLKEVMSPAIDLASDGVEVSPQLAAVIASNMRTLRKFPALEALLLKDGFPPVGGNFYTSPDRLVFRDLANTYRLIAQSGGEAFYRGSVAKTIADDMRLNGGILSEDDLNSYNSSTRTLSESDMHRYRGFSYTQGVSDVLVLALNVLENFDLVAMGPDSPAFRHVMLETLRLTWVNHFAFGSRPGMLTKQYAAELASRIRPGQTSGSPEPLDPGPYDGLPRGAIASPSFNAVRESPDTTTLVVADKSGNIFNILTSLGGSFGSCVVIPGTGIVLNDLMSIFDPVPGRPLSLGPTRRPPRGSNLPVFFRGGRPHLALSASGARRSFSAVTHVIVYVLEFGFTLRDAIEAPRVWAEALFDQVFVDSRVEPSTQAELARIGHQIVATDAAVRGGFGRATAVLIDESGGLQAGGDPNYWSSVAGY